MFEIYFTFFFDIKFMNSALMNFSKLLDKKHCETKLFITVILKLYRRIVNFKPFDYRECIFFSACHIKIYSSCCTYLLYSCFNFSTMNI